MVGYTLMLLSVTATATCLLENFAAAATTGGTALLSSSAMGNSDPKQKCGWKTFKKSGPCVCRFTSKWKTWKCKQYFQQEAEAHRTPRIINGDEVLKGTYPWFARAMLNDEWGGCGGSLVAPEFVLTAAHCTQGWKPVHEYQIGALCTNKSNNCGQNMVTAEVDQVYNHPKYNQNNMVNDFALVKLKDRVTGIAPVKMDMGGVVSKYSSDHKGLYAVGFGDQNPNWGTNFSKNLMHVELGYVPNNECNDYYSGNAIKGSMMCAADPNQDACQGDSGGPLYDANNGIKTLVGVVSWGYGCADPNFPGVYAKISNKWGWIKNTICSNHSTPKPDFCSNSPITPSAPISSPITQPTYLTPPTVSPITQPTYLTPPTVSPITQPPISLPTTSSTSGDSTLYCDENESEVEVVVELDSYPFETSWKIIDSAGIVMLEGGSYTEMHETITEKSCLNKGIGYIFTINDSYGDGLSGGKYLLKWDGQQIVDGAGNFGTTKSHEFGNQVDGGCGWRDGEKMKEFKLKLKTDDHGDETYYELKRGKKVVHANGYDNYFSSNTLHVDKLCVPDACYKLVMYDEYGDGMCCESSKGYYTVIYDGERVKYNRFKNGYKSVTKFGKCS